MWENPNTKACRETKKQSKPRHESSIKRPETETDEVKRSENAGEEPSEENAVADPETNRERAKVTLTRKATTYLKQGVWKK